MSEESFAYHVVYAGVIAGETRFGSQKVVTPVAFDNEEIVQQVAQQIKEKKHFLEVTIVNWIPLQV